MPAKFISISGPSHTGKTTLISLLSEGLRGYANVSFEQDMHEVVWNSLCDRGIFKEFHEITEDRDYLYLYISNLIDQYRFLTHEKYQGEDDLLVVLDGCHLDLLIYSMLNLWYHYPTKELQEVDMNKLLSMKDIVSTIFMLRADDESFPVSRKSTRERVTTFKRNRNLELTYYDIFRESNRVVDVPTTSLGEAEVFIVNELKSRGLIEK